MADDPLNRDFDSSFSKLLHPDFSGFLQDGQFDAVTALETHLCLADLLLRTAIAMTTPDEIPAFPNPEDRMFVIEMNLKTYREAVEAAVVEVNRLRNEFPLSDSHCISMVEPKEGA